MQARTTLSLTLIERGKADEAKTILDALIPQMEVAGCAMNPKTLYTRTVYVLPLLLEEVGEEHRYSQGLMELIESL